MTHKLKLSILGLILASTQSFAWTVSTPSHQYYKPTIGSLNNSVNIGGETVQFINSRTQNPMQIFQHNGEYYLAGEHGDPYQIKICLPYTSRYPTPRALNVVSVDGLNVISGKPAGYNQTGYVVDNGNCSIIKGWRKNMNEEAQFVLTDSSQSYASRTNNSQANIGVIGIAMFKEKIKIPTIDESTPIYSNMQDRVGSAVPMAPTSEESGAVSKLRSDVIPKQESKLGTGHGERVDSHATKTDFEKASENPTRIFRISYDSYKNLIAKGVIKDIRQNPNPFPESTQFAPDPIR